MFGNTDVKKPNVDNSNMGAYWGGVVLKALAPQFQTRSFNSRDTLEARDFVDEAADMWGKFAQKELLPYF